MITDLWYKNAIVYCLAVERFMDANGDGVGDFAGAARRLDYLHGLGVTTVWLLPFQPSPQRDDGYDISDYYGVDPRYGTLGDFVEFTHGAKQRGMRIIIDLVVNHTSDQHPWFKEARRDANSPYRDWYLWSTNGGGGIYSDDSSLTLTNSTISGNRARDGGGISVSGKTPELANTIAPPATMP